MVSTRKKYYRSKRQLSQLNDYLNDFIIKNNTIANAIGKETLEPQVGCSVNKFWRSKTGENSVSQDQVLEENIASKITIEVHSNVIAVENLVHDAFLTATDNVVISRVELAVRSITE